VTHRTLCLTERGVSFIVKNRMSLPPLYVPEQGVIRICRSYEKTHKNKSNVYYRKGIYKVTLKLVTTLSLNLASIRTRVRLNLSNG
jgi:hypothetical protein